MKKWKLFGAVVLTLTLCIVSAALLLECMKPMEDKFYDLSLGFESEGEGMPDDWVYDQKNWTVFTQEGETVTELTADGSGGFLGLAEPGQTFYFSRVLSEEVDSPTLRLDLGGYAAAVFLDGTLLYTDCPELTGGIGELRLPMLEWWRDEPLVVALPENYTGKTLTIAQSTDPAGSELQEETTKVWPCNVTLYCGSAYESALTAKSFQTAVPVTLAFAAVVLLMALFLWQAFRGQFPLDALCGAFMAFFWMAGQLLPNARLGPLSADGTLLSRDLSLILLMLFLAFRLTRGLRIPAAVFAGIYGAGVAADVVMQSMEQLTLGMTVALSTIGLAGLAAAFICGVLEWKRNRFFRVFCPLTAAGAAAWAASGYCQFPGYILYYEIPGHLLYPLAGIMTAAAVATVLAEMVRREIARQTEARLLAQRSKLAQSSYESMRQQNEQVMMLRHDMMKHFHLLRQTTADEKTAAYLDELIGENEKIRPVVQSGNEMLDIILNGKLGQADAAGIAVEIARMDAPEKLPLSDAELCSLMMNLLDNALEAASADGVKRRYIKLDMHIRNRYFVFICENGATLDWINKKTAPGRGLGLKAVQRIVEQYGNLSDTEYGDDYYKMTVLLALGQPLK